MGNKDKYKNRATTDPFDEDYNTFKWRMTVARPTTSSARRSKLWSRERQNYEEEHRRIMEDFKNRPYLRYEYPELKKHYPGTWRVANSIEVDEIVKRLTRKPKWIYTTPPPNNTRQRLLDRAQA
ncbi:hypothetical protein SNE40_000778 [Patella caerulea]|uniref:Uncharacterized protein n=1 Tax=Patella caerulea TaxID=87958 RepID=A0AAN8KFK4_PATCE